MKNVDSAEEVRRGSCVVKIYATPSKGRELYTLSYWLNGKRHRSTFANHDKARKEAERVATNMAKGELAVLTLRDHDRLAYVRAVEALRPTGVPLELSVIAAGIEGIIEKCGFRRSRTLIPIHVGQQSDQTGQ